MQMRFIRRLSKLESLSLLIQLTCSYFTFAQIFSELAFQLKIVRASCFFCFSWNFLAKESSNNYSKKIHFFFFLTVIVFLCFSEKLQRIIYSRVQHFSEESLQLQKCVFYHFYEDPLKFYKVLCRQKLFIHLCICIPMSSV